MIADISNVGPLGVAGALTGTIIDQFRQARREAAISKKQKQFGRSASHSYQEKSLMWCAIALSLIGAIVGIMNPWYRTDILDRQSSFVERPTAMAKSVFGVLRKTLD